MDELSLHLYILGQFERYGETALIVAAKRRNLDHVKILVENGADLNIGLTNACPDRSTALDFAKDSKHSGRYGHVNETLILQNFAFIMQFYTYFNPYDMN